MGTSPAICPPQACTYAIRIKFPGFPEMGNTFVWLEGNSGRGREFRVPIHLDSCYDIIWSLIEKRLNKIFTVLKDGPKAQALPRSSYSSRRLGLVRCSVVNSRGHHTPTPCPRVPITLLVIFSIHVVIFLALCRRVRELQ